MLIFSKFMSKSPVIIISELILLNVDSRVESASVNCL